MPARHHASGRLPSDNTTRMDNIIVPSAERLPWAMTLGELMDKAVSLDPDKAYLYYKDLVVTYQELLEYTLATAALFRDMGVEHGDRVCVFLPNGPEYIFIWMGLARLGAICVPINTAFKRDETAYILNNAQPKVLVAHDTLIEVAHEAAQLYPSLSQILTVSNDSGPRGNQRDFWALLGQTSPISLGELGDVKPTDISMLVYTSGTTGNPKGVMITHEMYVAAGQGFATWTAAGPDDRFFTCLPFFHANTHYYSTMGSLTAGASLVLEDRFSASRFLQQVRESKATVVNFIGMMLPVMLKSPSLAIDRDNSVRVFYGSPAPSPETLAEFEERFGARVLTAFGMTESCYGTIERMDQPHRPGTAGIPRWHPDPRFQNQLRITDEKGRSLGPRKVGEITLKSPAVTPGYWRDTKRTEEALRDGWLYTGDLGWVDEDGYLYFVDRKKDVIRRRGENISSQEVEDVIRKHPDVMDCAVIAVPSELGDHEIKAYVVPGTLLTPSDGAEESTSTLSPEDIVYWCAERLAYFKVPRYLEFREELPKTPTMRVRKDVLRVERDDLTTDCFDREEAGIQLRR